MITRIYADNFRCFSNFEIRPQRMNLLVGDNGSGKSALLDLLGGFGMLVRSSDGLRRASESGGALHGSFTRWQQRAIQSFELEFNLDSRRIEWKFVLAAGARGEPSIDAETIAVDGDLVAELVEGPNKSLQLRGNRVPIPYKLDASLLALDIADPVLQSLRAYIGRIGTLRPDVAHLRSVSETGASFLRFDASNFVDVYRDMRGRDFETIKRLHDQIKARIGGFRSLELEPMGAGAEKLVVKLYAGAPNGPDYSLDFDELSSGQKALIVLYYLVSARNMMNRVATFDEPDNFVSLGELQPWLQLLTRRTEEEKLQVFIASHNPEVIDYLAADTVWLFEREEGGPARVRPLPVDPDSGLKASEQLQRGWTLGA